MAVGWELGLGLFAAIAAVGLLVFAYLEYEIYLMRTSIEHLPTGMLFTCRLFDCEMVRSTRQCRVRTWRGQGARHAEGHAAATEHAAPFKVSLPAAGLVVEVVAPETEDPTAKPAVFNLVFRASDALERQAQGQTGAQAQVLSLERIPAPIAIAFRAFVQQAQVWIDKATQNLEAQIQARERQAEEEALAAKKALEQAEKARAKERLQPSDPKERIEARIAQWREAAGFTGTFSAVDADAQGNITWFVDMDLSGHITLFADKRVYHGSLKGAAIRSRDGALEVSVRDADASEAAPQLRTFAILKGAAPDVCRAWLDRLTMVCDGLGGYSTF